MDNDTVQAHGLELKVVLQQLLPAWKLYIIFTLYGYALNLGVGDTA